MAASIEAFSGPLTRLLFPGLDDTAKKLDSAGQASIDMGKKLGQISVTPELNKISDWLTNNITDTKSAADGWGRVADAIGRAGSAAGGLGGGAGAGLGGGGGTDVTGSFGGSGPGKGGRGLIFGSDAALLSHVPSGRYAPIQGTDLTKGLADCSSAVSDLVRIMDGESTSGGRVMSTGNEAQWLAQHGFIPTNVPMPGTFQVGFNAGHTQATLPGGTNFNWGNDAAAAAGGVDPGSGGAWMPGFTQHYYRPVGGGGMPSYFGRGMGIRRGGGSGAWGSGGGGWTVPLPPAQQYGSNSGWGAVGSDSGSPAPSGPPGLTGPNIDTSAPYYPVDPNQKGATEAQRAQDELNNAQYRLAEAQQKLADLTAKGTATQEELNTANRDVAVAQRDVNEKTQDLSKSTSDTSKTAREASSGRGSKTESEFSSAGSGLLKGLGQEMGFGDLFGKPPWEWGSFKLLAGLAGWAGGEANAWSDFIGKGNSWVTGGQALPGFGGSGNQGGGGGGGSGLGGALAGALPGVGALLKAFRPGAADVAGVPNGISSGSNIAQGNNVFGGAPGASPGPSGAPVVNNSSFTVNNNGPDPGTDAESAGVHNSQTSRAQTNVVAGNLPG